MKKITKLKKILRKIFVPFKNSYNFAFISTGTNKRKTLVLSAVWLNVLFYTTIIFVVGVGLRTVFWGKELFFLRRVAGPILEENDILKKENNRLILEKEEVVKKMDSLQKFVAKERERLFNKLNIATSELEGLKHFINELKILANMKVPETQAKRLNGPVGIGGVDMDTSVYRKMFEKRIITDYSTEGIVQRARKLANEIKGFRHGLKPLREKFERKLSIIEGRPYGWPCIGPITSPFGPRKGHFHTGIDIGAPLGTPVFSTGDGVVVFKGYAGGYGNVIKIDHGKGFATLYAHLLKYHVSIGDRISKGDVIGYVGSTGNTTGPHLHYEVQINGVPVNPEPYLEIKNQ